MVDIKELDEITRSKFRTHNINPKDERIILHRIAKLIIRFTHKHHKKERDIIGELYDNSLAISQTIGQEIERIRMREKEDNIPKSLS